MAARLPGRFASPLAGLAAVVALALALAAPWPLAAADDYVLAEGDVLEISVFDHPDLATTTRVARDGQVRFPLVGSVPAAGLTAARVADVITAKLANGYLVAPQVTVGVKEYRVRKVTVTGSVNHPGVYEFRGRMTFLELLSRAGGLAPGAGTAAVIRRRGAAPEAAITIDLRSLLVGGNVELDAVIDDGDSVTVAEAGVFVLVGEVQRPGEYRFEPGMTLLRGVTLAGGFTPRASPERIRITRKERGGERTIEAGPAPAGLERPLEPGDVVTVPDVGVYYLTGEVRRPGEYRFEEGMTVMRAVALAGGLTEQAHAEGVRIIRSEEGQERVVEAGRGAPGLEVPLRRGDVVSVPSAGRYYLTGEVRRPGEYRFEEGMTLVRAATLAGGFTERADTERVRVIRTEEGRERVLEVAAAGAGAEEPLHRGDIVVVNAARSEVCYVTGEVRSTGAYRCDRETTVMKAVALAGGFTDAAARGRIRIVRRVNGQEQVREKVGLDEPVQPDDVIVVPRSFF